MIICNNINSGKNGNRTKLTINGQITTYCYDFADRLIKSSDDKVGVPVYDSRGNIIQLGTEAQKTNLEFDASERNTKITEMLAPGEGSNTSQSTKTTETTYDRDVQSRITKREVKVNGQAKSVEQYVYTGASDTPDALLDTNGNVQQKYLALPGDVLVTIKPGSASAGAMTLSLPNIHGDIFATVNADGALISSFTTGPFGEPIATDTPANTGTDSSWQYLGQHQKLTETSLSLGPIQMGARVYLPTIGRFASVDPIEGGTDNSYSYTNDPVNETDLSGNIIETIADVAGIGYDSYQMATHPSWGNLGMLGWSVAATFIPFVPGSYVGRAGAAAVKGAKAIEKADVVKRTSKAAAKPPAPKNRGFSKKVKEQVKREEKKCAYCGARKPAKVDIDHVKSKKRGGSNKRSNAQMTCASCNRSKGAGRFPKNYSFIQKAVWYVKRIFSLKWW